MTTVIQHHRARCFRAARCLAGAAGRASPWRAARRGSVLSRSLMDDWGVVPWPGSSWTPATRFVPFTSGCSSRQSHDERPAMTEAPDIGHPDLSHKVCLITGASRGIGAAAARYIAAAGATVILGARKVDSSQRVVEQIVSAGGAAEAIMLDVTDDDCVAGVVNHIESTYGALHLAFNNAGTQGPSAPIHQQDPAEVARILDVNLLGVYRAMRHEIPAMLR